MDDPIEQELIAAQAAIVEAQQATIRRQDAVSKAISAGWTKYRIAATLGVKEPTVTSIINTAKKNAAKADGGG